MVQDPSYTVNYRSLFSAVLRTCLKETRVVKYRDRMRVLQDSTRPSPCKMTEKKRLLCNLIRYRIEIGQVATALNEVFHTNLKQNIDLVMSSRASDVSCASNLELAIKIINLFDPFEVLPSKMNNQAEAENRRSTRQATKSMPMQLAQDTTELKGKVNLIVIDSNVGEICKLIKQVKLTPN